MDGSSNALSPLARGVYRYQYAGFKAGKRINALSLPAEAWFWRVHSAADDYGNVPADPSLLYTATAGRRAGRVSIDQVMKWIGEMVRERLLVEYAADGEAFYHVVGFLTIQPAPRNGKRVRRIPSYPGEGAELAGRTETPADAGGNTRAPCAGESGGVQGNPGGARASHSQTQPQSHSPPGPRRRGREREAEIDRKLREDLPPEEKAGGAMSEACGTGREAV